MPASNCGFRLERSAFPVFFRGAPLLVVLLIQGSVQLGDQIHKFCGVEFVGRRFTEFPPVLIILVHKVPPFNIGSQAVAALTKCTDAEASRFPDSERHCVQ
jgi:hypothetical protein